MAVDLNLTDSTQYNMTLYQGRTLDKDIICDVYSGNTLVGQFDFTTYTGATMTFKIKPTDPYSVLSFDTSDGSIVLGSNGMFSLNKSATEMNIKAGVYFYDMYLRNGVTKRQFLNGQVLITQKVTD